MEFKPTVVRSSLDPSEDKEWQDLVLRHDVFLVEEGHFFKDLKAFCLFAVRRGKSVFISCLNATSEQVMFPSIVDVLPYANEIQLLESTCKMCGEMAHLTTALRPKTGLIQVGGASMYAPVCLRCLDARSTISITEGMVAANSTEAQEERKLAPIHNPLTTKQVTSF